MPPLSRGTCPEAGLDPEEIGRIVPELRRALGEDGPGCGYGGGRAWCAGAVVLVGRGDVVVLHEAVGWGVRYSGYDGGSGCGVELPVGEWVGMGRDTVFDLASLTKLFTAAVALQQVEAGAIELDRSLSDYLPGYAHREVTPRHLLAHTSGLRPELPLYALAGPVERAGRLAAEEPLTAPGSTRTYSDLNLLLTQVLLERTTGRPLDGLVADGITGPLGMGSTRFNPPASWRPRIAATEDQRRPWGKLDRGLVHGAVHDENAYAMGGVAGHAGLFSTAWDLALFARALLTGALPLQPGLGFESDQPWFMGELAGTGALGHTGFTGTSLVLHPPTDSYLILLANTVHPVRHRQGSGPRAAAATRLARALLPGEPRQ